MQSPTAERLVDGEGFHAAWETGAVFGDYETVLGADAEIAAELYRLKGRWHDGTSHKVFEPPAAVRKNWQKKAKAATDFTD